VLVAPVIPASSIAPRCRQHGPNKKQWMSSTVGPAAEHIARVVAENLVAMLGTPWVTCHRRRSVLDYLPSTARFDWR
jgi:hypothetical protein